MIKKNLIEIDGIIKEVMQGGNFKIILNNGKEIIAYASGKMRKNFIKIVLGDKVRVVVSPYDISRGRIIFRTK